MKDYAWRIVAHPLAIVTRRGWRWGQDPRRADGRCLISPRGTIYEVKHNRAGTFARRFEPHSNN